MSLTLSLSLSPSLTHPLFFLFLSFLSLSSTLSHSISASLLSISSSLLLCSALSISVFHSLCRRSIVTSGSEPHPRPSNCPTQRQRRLNSEPCCRTLSGSVSAIVHPYLLIQVPASATRHPATDESLVATCQLPYVKMLLVQLGDSYG